MKNLKSLYAAPSLFVLLLSAVLLSLASCGGGGGGGSSNGGGSPAIPLTASAITAGQNHTCAIVEGKAWCWGDNTKGKLGDGTVTTFDSGDIVNDNNRMVPVQVSGLTSDVTAISVGSVHTCAILSTDAAQCWGFGGNGRLGSDDTDDSSTPIDVTDLDSDVTAISAGGGHTCVIHSGAAKCWGFNFTGQLGDGSSDDRDIPVAVTGLENNVNAISAGGGHTCAIHNGVAKCWGSNQHGRLGNNEESTFNNESEPLIEADSKTPVPVMGLDSDVKAIISAGISHTCAIVEGKAWCWGNNGSGRLGDGSTTQSLVPVAVVQTAADPDNSIDEALLEVDADAKISAGGAHTCVVHKGAAKCWGGNVEGQLGVATSTTSSTIPVQVEGLESDVTAISAGDDHTCAVHSGVAKCWGFNNNGRLGVGVLAGAAAFTSTPQTVSFEE